MADVKISALTAGTTLASGDLVPVVDISDTTMAASGTDKKWTMSLFSVGVSGAGAPGGTGTNGEWYYDTTNFRAYRSDGVGWVIMSEPRQSWTPTASWTIGNGTWVAGYQRQDGLCFIDGAFTFGTTSAIAGSASIATPVAALGTPTNQFTCGFDIAGEFYTGNSAAIAAAGTSLVLRAIDTAATYARFANTSGTIPGTFTTGSKINFAGWFRMNTRYL